MLIIYSTLNEKQRHETTETSPDFFICGLSFAAIHGVARDGIEVRTRARL